MNDLYLPVKAGTTDKIVRFILSAQTTGAPVNEIPYDFEGLYVYYWREGDSSPTTIGLNAGTLGTWSSGGWAFDGSSSTGSGVYELGIPNAALASGADYVDIVCWITGGTNTQSTRLHIDLVAYNQYDGVRLGLTSLPNAAANASGGLVTNGISTGQISLSGGSVLVQNGTGTGQLSLNTGRVRVYTNDDKSAYSLSQTFPANFATLSITGGGQVSVATNSDKTGYTLTQAFPANFGALSISGGGAVTAGTVNDKSGYSISGTTTTFDALQTALNSAHGSGSWLTPTGFSTLTQADIRTATGLASPNLDQQFSDIENLLTGVTVNVVSPVVSVSSISIEREDDYYAADGRGIAFSFTGVPDLTGATVYLAISEMATQTGTVLSEDSITFDLPSTETRKPQSSPIRFTVTAVLANTHRITLAEGQVNLL